MASLLDDPVKLRDVAFRLIRDVYKLPPTTEEDLNSLVLRVQSVHAGLNPEMEFFALVSWMGRCAGIFPVEDLPPPVAGFKKEFRPPDFLAVCRYNGKPAPVLIEFKTSADGELVWSEAYHDSFRRFADLLHLPLLVAWKRNEAWVLADVEHFRKRHTAYHLSYETALEENLMSMMFGDAMVVLKEDFQFFVEATVAEPLPPGQLIPEGEYTFARFREALQEGLKLGTVRYLLEQEPRTPPPFLDNLN